MMWDLLVREPARHLYRLLKNEDYRRWQRLNAKLIHKPRYVEGRAHVFEWDLRFPDAASFLSAYKEIFFHRIHDLPTLSEAPRIVDWGANVGLSVLFFKRAYPAARITAVEADPKVFAYLESNLRRNGFSDVELINKAVWREDGAVRFFPEGADSGRVDLSRGAADTITIDAISAPGFLDGDRVDYLKIDIEGAEADVLPACGPYLGNVERVFVEFHSRVGQPQRLDEIVDVLAQAGFRLHVHPVFTSRSPFVRVHTYGEFDLQLNLFGWRPEGGDALG
jgi:FkbM family methyltransferase